MLETIKKEWQAMLAVFLFIAYSAVWILIQTPAFKPKFLDFYEQTYAVMALWGGFWGIVISRQWGFLKSIMGKAIFLLSCGLLAQVFGQVVYTYYVYIAHIDVPYPSIGDIGYFGSIPFYFFGVFLLAKASGIKFGLKSIENKIIAIIIPILILIGAYLLFLQGYKFDWSDPVKIFLDFGYPLGQAIYISLTLLTYLISRSILGGIMRSKIIFLLFALFCQFASDYIFLFQVSRGTWQLGGINEYMYLGAYFVMTIGIFQFNTVARKLKEED